MLPLTPPAICHAAPHIPCHACLYPLLLPLSPPYPPTPSKFLTNALICAAARAKYLAENFSSSAGLSPLP